MHKINIILTLVQKLWIIFRRYHSRLKMDRKIQVISSPKLQVQKTTFCKFRTYCWFKIPLVWSVKKITKPGKGLVYSVHLRTFNIIEQVKLNLYLHTQGNCLVMGLFNVGWSFYIMFEKCRFCDQTKNIWCSNLVQVNCVSLFSSPVLSVGCTAYSGQSSICFHHLWLYRGIWL